MPGTCKTTMRRLLIALLVLATLGGNVVRAADGPGAMPTALEGLAPSLPNPLQWTGYVAEPFPDGSGAILSVKGQWVVPTLSCGSSWARTFSSVWVGIDGYTNGTLEQVGTWHYCLNGYPLHGAFYQMYPAPAEFPTFPLRPGDLVQAEVRYTGADQFRVRIENLTTGLQYTTVATQSRAARASAAWVVEAPYWDGTVQSMPNFTPVQFQQASVSAGGTVGSIRDLRWEHEPVLMRRPDGTRLTAPSRLSLDGRSFTVARTEGEPWESQAEPLARGPRTTSADRVLTTGSPFQPRAARAP